MTSKMRRRPCQAWLSSQEPLAVVDGILSTEHSRWVLFHPHTAECPKEGVQLSLKESELPWDPKTLLLGSLSSWTERLSIEGRDSLF